MTVKSAPYYWLVCDGCDRRSPDDWSEVAAWESAGSARERAAFDDGWTRIGDEDFCGECSQRIEDAASTARELAAYGLL
jgi:hypothetical protein